MKAMILAAGRGERMRPLTDAMPKPLLQVGGKALIEYHLEAIARAGIREVVVNVSWHGQQIRNALGDGSRWGLDIRISDEGPEPLETGGGIYRALPLLGPDPFLVVNGDIWTDFPFGQLRLAPGDLAHLVLVPNPDFHPQGDFGLEGDRLVREAPVRYTFSGIAMYRPEFFAGCRPARFPLLPLLLEAIDRRTASAELYTGVWNDIGTPQRLEQLRASL